MHWQDKEYDKKYHREYMRDLRAYWKAHYKCKHCGKQDAYTLNGRWYCFECGEKVNAQKRGKRDTTKKNARAKAKRDARREAGLCTQCGKELPQNEDYKFVMCPTCRAKAAQYAIKKHRREGIVPKSEFVNNGLCAICGKEKPADIELAFLDRKTVLCEKCYERSKAALKKAAERFKEIHGQSWGQMQFERYKRLREAKNIGERKANEGTGS